MTKKIFSFLKFLAPISFLIFFLWPMVSGKKFITSDTSGMFALIKFFIANISSGVFPLWNPLSMWGCPVFIENCYFSAYNPVWLLILILYKLGLSYYFSFLFTWVLYYLSGVFGFYLLAKSFFKSSFLGYISFLLLLFSAFSFLFFFHSNHVFIYVPSIWFFYFLIRFIQKPDRPMLMGLVFSLMIVSTTYLPIYWIMFMFAVSLLCLLLFFDSFKKSSLGVSCFIKKNYIFTLICFFILGVSCFPPLKAYFATSEKQVVFVERHIQNPEEALEEGASINLEQLKRVALEPKYFLEQLFPERKDLTNRNKGISYVPIFVYIVLLFSFILPITKRNVFLALLTMLFFFIIIGPFSPVYPFLFNVLPFLKLIHGIALFRMALLISLILLSVENLKLILSQEHFFIKNDRPWMTMIIHGVFLIFLLMQKNPFWTSYGTVLLSYAFFICAFSSNEFLKKFRFLILFLCIILQPAQIFLNFSKHIYQPAPKVQESFKMPLNSMNFVYERPVMQGKSSIPGDQYYQYFLSLSSMSEYPEMLLYGGGMPSRWSYQLYASSSEKIISNYLKYRFFVYDYILPVYDEQFDEVVLEDIFKNQENLAFISLSKSDSLDLLNLSQFMRKKKDALELALPIKKEMDQFSVVSFNANSVKVKTNFDKNKFLVYNDSYLPDWRVFVNGKKQRVFRSNVAFKGVVLPAGENIVEFRFNFLGGTYMNNAIYLVYIVFFILMICAFIMKKE